MNPDLMRKIDRFLGTPLCWLCTLARRIGRLFGRKGEPRTPQRILFIELAEIGGLVVAYPSLAHAREKFPEAELYFLTFSGGKGILDLMGLVDEEHQVIIRAGGLITFVADTFRALLKMRALKIDTVINLEAYARFSTLLAFLSGACTRVGFHRFYEEGHYLGDLLTHRVIYSPHVHAAETFITLVEAAGQAPGTQPAAKLELTGYSLDPPKIETTPQNRDFIWQQLHALYPGIAPEHRLVIMNPNASDLVAARRWPTEYFLELGRELLKDEGICLVLTGTPEERPAAEEVQIRLGHKRVLNMAGQTTLPQLIDLYNQASLLITNDSGPAHFASLTELPVLVLFGPETPKIYGPLGKNVEKIYLGLACSPCVSVYNQKRSPCTDNVCLKSITPAEILARARQILGGSQGS